jgi:hypothetical protein
MGAMSACGYHVHTQERRTSGGFRSFRAEKERPLWMIVWRWMFCRSGGSRDSDRRSNLLGSCAPPLAAQSLRMSEYIAVSIREKI